MFEKNSSHSQRQLMGPRSVLSADRNQYAEPSALTDGNEVGVTEPQGTGTVRRPIVGLRPGRRPNYNITIEIQKSQHISSAFCSPENPRHLASLSRIAIFYNDLKAPSKYLLLNIKFSMTTKSTLNYNRLHIQAIKIVSSHRTIIQAQLRSRSDQEFHGRTHKISLRLQSSPYCLHHGQPDAGY